MNIRSKLLATSLFSLAAVTACNSLLGNEGAGPPASGTDGGGGAVDPNPVTGTGTGTGTGGDPGGSSVDRGSGGGGGNAGSSGAAGHGGGSSGTGGTGGSGGNGGSGGSGGTSGSSGAAGSAGHGGASGAGGSVGVDAGPRKCDPPYVLAGVTSKDTSSHARVMRLDPSGPEGTEKCAALTASGTLDANIDALAFIPPNTTAIAANSNVVFQGSDDLASMLPYKPSDSSDQTNIDGVFPFQDASGNTVVGVAFDSEPYLSNPLDVDIGRVDIVQGGTRIQRWATGSTTASQLIHHGSWVKGITQDPLNPARLFISDQDGTSGCTCGEIDAPWDTHPRELSCYQQTVSSAGWLRMVRATKQGSVSRFIYTRANQSIPTENDVVYELDVTGSTKTPKGPLTCSLTDCLQPNDLDETVADPVHTDAVLSLCKSKTNDKQRHVVRMYHDGRCEMVYNAGSHLLSMESVTVLAITGAGATP